MKLCLLLSTVFSIAIACVSDAQTTYIDQMVQDNINLRRKEEIYKSRKSQTSVSKSKVDARPVIRPLELNIAPDMYDPFFRSNSNGISIEFTITSSLPGGKSFVRNYKLVGNDEVKITNVPAGNYVISARSSGNTILLATTSGEPSNPNGGNYAASQRIQIAAGKDDYGNAMMRSTPSLIWLRVR